MTVLVRFRSCLNNRNSFARFRQTGTMAGVGRIYPFIPKLFFQYNQDIPPHRKSKKKDLPKAGIYENVQNVREVRQRICRLNGRKVKGGMDGSVTKRCRGASF